MSLAEDNRPPLAVDPDTPRGRWHVEVVAVTESTNADVAERFRRGEGEGLVLVAEDQTAGRGRLGRDWVTRPQSSLTVSFLVVPPDLDPERWPWLPLVTGLAAVAAVRRVTGLPVGCKWPNDVMVGGKKVGGILLERVERGEEAAAVIGIGLNCHQTTEELPVPGATSLDLETGDQVDRTALLEALIAEVATQLHQWAGGADLRPAYRQQCTTVGQEVRVEVPGGQVTGQAVDIDDGGRLVVRTATGEEALGAGDVVHVRPVQD